MNQTTKNPMDRTKCPDSKNMKIKTNSKKNRLNIMTILDKATTHLENKNIPSTNNKIENIFQKVLLKHIKRTMKIKLGVLTRFMLKLNHWNINNEKEKNHTSF